MKKKNKKKTVFTLSATAKTQTQALLLNSKWPIQSGEARPKV